VSPDAIHLVKVWLWSVFWNNVIPRHLCIPDISKDKFVLDASECQQTFCWSAALISSRWTRDLGVTIDAHLTTQNQFDDVARTAASTISYVNCGLSDGHSHSTPCLRRYRSSSPGTRVHYCNAVCMFSCIVRRLQAVLHAAVRLITGTHHSNTS